MQDSLIGGRKFRAFTAIDVFSRESVAIEVAFDMKGTRVTDGRNKFTKRAGARPQELTLDYGTEFRSHRFDEWAYQRKIQLDFIRPGKPMENAYIESFNGSLRDECLNANWFTDLDDAMHMIEGESRRLQSGYRPHSSLGQLPPAALRRSTRPQTEDSKPSGGLVNGAGHATRSPGNERIDQGG